MGAGKGGVDAAAAAAAPEAARPVVLNMDLHCAGCAHKVRKAIKRLPGVESVVAEVAAKRVVVAGTADAAVIKARIEAKTGKVVEVVSAGTGPENAEESGEQKADKDGGVAGEKKGGKDASPKEEEEEKQQPPEETEPKVEATVLLKIRLHCDGCADRIRRRIHKFKGVKDVAVDGNAKDEVKVSGTMDVPALLAYLREKLDRPVEPVASGQKDGAGEVKDKGGDGAAAVAGGDDEKDTGKGIDDEKAGSYTAVAAAAAFVAPAPAEASTHHVPPPYGYVAYPQMGPATSSYYYGNADGVGYSSTSTSASAYDHQQQYSHSHPEAGQHQAYAPYPYHVAPPPQLFSDENPNACSVM